MQFNKKYFIAFLAFFLIELFIALYVHDTIIRPFIGDVLVIILLYNFIKIFFTKTSRLLPVYLFVLGTLVEVAQYFNILEKLHLSDYKVMRILVGTTFDVKDIICYFIGAILLMGYELILKTKSNEKVD